MTAEQFVFWLQGFFEISDDKATKLNEKQIKIIKNHLGLVFFHDIDPKYSDDPAVQEKMNELHSGDKKETTEVEVDMSKDIVPAKPEKKPYYPSSNKNSGGMFPSISDTVYRC